MAKKTRTELSTSAINTNLPDNTQELITPTTERAQLTDERESVINYKDDLGGTGNAGKFLTVAVDGESLTMVDAPTGDVTGTGAQYQVAVWDGTNSLTGNAAFQFLTGAQNSIKLIRGTGSGNILFYAADGTTLHGYIENQVSGNGLTIGQQDGSTSAVIDLDDSTITFKTDNNTALTISSGGNATLNGYLKLGTSASQTILGDFGSTDTYLINYNSVGTLKFLVGGGASSNERLTIGSNWTSNLDAYEEGTWTPNLYIGTTATSATIVISQAIYTRVGRLVNAYVYLSSITNVANNGNQLYIGGLPYNSYSGAYYSTGQIGYSNTANIESWRPLVETANSRIYFHEVNGNTSPITGTQAQVLNSKQIIITITYFT